MDPEHYSTSQLHEESELGASELAVSSARLAHLQSIADSALGYMSLEEMLSELLERIRGGLGADTAAILLLDEDRDVLLARAARGLEEEVRQGVQVPLARGFAGRVAAERRPIVIEDLDHADVVNPILRQKGIRSMLGVPVQVEGRVIGVMHIGTLRRRDFDGDDIALLQLAADRAALGIDNAHRTEQRAVTEALQRTLLPEALPQLPGIVFSARYLPAGTAVRIGGDWYDVFPLPNGKIALVVGDVVGRGVVAATVMAEIRTSLRAFLLEGHELVKAMTLLNELVLTMGRNRGATVATLQLDLERSELELVNAGHLPPLLMSPHGEVRLLDDVTSMPVGMRAATRYESTRHPFDTGSVLLLYTDGLVERRGESIEDGLERLRGAALLATDDDYSPLADRVYRAMIRAATLEDDLALLAVESVPLGETLEATLPARPAVVAGLRRTLGRWLAAAGADEEALFDVTLSTSEAATNAIEHAYGLRESTFTVRCAREGGQVTVTVTDKGRWRAVRPMGGGRGLEIMRRLMDSVEVERSPQGTVVTMTRRLSDAP
ncbi:MAG TPA: SpoIIE family protein phosphatase [Solirubrobacteraceae bacterium]|nr:SpoIIE family protein phosphatase [Solirubrobacteraceae bacterium]